MVARFARRWWDGRNELLAVVFASLFAAGCASIPSLIPTASTPAPAPIVHSDDDDFSQLIAQMRADLNRYNARETASRPVAAAQSAKARDREFQERARALFSPLGNT